jgi:carboxyl-terminal processing protease
MKKSTRTIVVFGLGLVAGGLLTTTVLVQAATRPLNVAELRRFTEAYALIQTRHLEEFTDRQMVDASLRGLTSGLDPESDFLDEEEMQAARAAAESKLGGFGLELRMEDGYAVVVTTVDGSPALRARMRPGDILLEINGTPSKGLTLSQATKRLRGDVGTEVRLTVIRQGEPRPFVVTAVLEPIRVSSVKSRVLEGAIAYVRISQFNERTLVELVEQIDHLPTPIKGLVLDLRSNPGGVIKAVIGVASAFLPSGETIMYSEGRQGENKQVYRAVPADYRFAANNDDVLARLPKMTKTVRMVLLVDRGSAAGAEIAAGALQDHKRAVILGERTVGRTTIQEIFPLPGNTGAIKLTTGRWITPRGRSLAGTGVAPDVVVAGVARFSDDAEARDAQLDTALRLLRDL